MPKILQNENGSEPNLFKIQKGSNIWTNLAVPINTSVDFSSQMKKSVRPLFSILLFMVFVATLSFRAAIHGGGSGGRFFFNSVELENKGPVQTTAPVFNSTLLKYATIDLGEDKTKLEIQQLLEGDLDGSRGRYRTISTWRRFHHDVRMTPSSGNSFRSPSFYRYWLDFRRNLNEWARKKRLQADIMNDLIELVKNPIDRHNGLFTDLGKRYKTCAVVGNSGILLKSNYGKLIDTHEMVIRLNNAKTDRYEQNVGSKTGLSFVNSNILHLCARRQGCFCHPYGDNIPIIMYICQPIHFLDYTVCNSSHKSPLLVTDPRFDSLCARIVKYYSVKLFVEELEKPLNEWSLAHDGSLFHYSSGMQAVMVALGICDKVSMFGFGKSASAKHHYHTNQKAELHLHDYEAEYRFYSDLVENPRAIPFISDKFKVPPVKIYH